MGDKPVDGYAEAIRAAVGRLTEQARLPIIRDDGSTSWGIVPSLWEMTEEALSLGTEASDVVVSRPHRAPIDLNLMEIRLTITEVTARELGILHREHGWPIDRSATMPEQLRSLAAGAITWGKNELDYWAHRFEQWARVLSNYLEPVRQANHIRSPCPRCLVDRVRVDYGPEQVLVYPIRIWMHRDKVIHYMQCQNADCAATWFRGDALHALADEIRNTPQQHTGPLRIARETLDSPALATA